ncbi:HAD family hydrolase [Anaeromicropila herbilytica]|uniref:Haloacid dehalogenase n=1 Tax=Anaeromicropila herbilytica TaxID=2785025 RepID=A0A7R7IDZ4_9FIRM|nr:HAD family hydrolase [Anaeromicropila herbilytica]BCN32077.1 haloacid dehalogenase [Anaeromicropila herbilytica]
MYKHTYKNYIFDLYGTLVNIHTNEKKKYLWDKLALFYRFQGANYQPLELKNEYKRLCDLLEEKLTNVDYPEIEITKVFQMLFQNKSIDANLQLAKETGTIFRALSIQDIGLYDGVIDLLDELQKKDKKIYLLSNAQQIFTEPEMKMLDIYDYFDGILFSSDQGCKKPSPLLYQAILQKYNLCKEDSIMIGNDYIADIKGANTIGLSSLYIHSNLSPNIEDELLSNYSIMDGDVNKIKKMIL